MEVKKQLREESGLDMCFQDRTGPAGPTASTGGPFWAVVRPTKFTGRTNFFLFIYFLQGY